MSYETPIHVPSLHLSHALVRACLGAGKMGGGMSFSEYFYQILLDANNGKDRTVLEFDKWKQADDFRERVKNNNHIKTITRSHNKLTITYDKRRITRQPTIRP